MDRTRSFVWEKDDERNTAGWRAEDNPYFSPTLDFGLCHDILEHMNNMPGMDAECEALGILVWGRVSMNYFSSYQVGTVAVASDIMDFFRDGADMPGDVENEPLGPEDCEDHVLVETLIGDVCQEVEAMMEDWSEYDPTRECPPIEETGRRIAGHMRRGVRRAHKEYGDRVAFQLAFEHLEDHFAIKGWCREHDYGREEFQPGDRLTVTVDPMMRRIHVEVEYHDYAAIEAEMEAENET